MQKTLFIILGVLGIVLLVELGVLMWQKNTPLPPVTISQIPKVTVILLPYSSQSNKNIKYIALSENLVKKGYVGWQDGDFFYNTPKEDKKSVPPFSLIGTVRKIEDTRLEIETKGSDAKIYTIKAELSSKSEIIKTTKDKTGKRMQTNDILFWQEIKIGSRVRIYPLIQKWAKNGYFVVTKVYILST